MLLRIHPIWSYAAMNFEAFPSAAHRDKDGLCLENSSENLQKSLATSFADAAIPSEAGLRTTLLANDPIRHLKILTAIDDELSHARSFSISVAFITKSGIAPLLLTLQRLAAKGVHGRILTTDYLYFTEPGALRQLLALPNLEVRIFRTQGAAGFHTKGYIFHSSNNLLRIIIGSSNLTLSALTTNREWNTRIVACERGELAQSILAEFDSLWSDAASRDAALEMEAYEREYRQLGAAQLEARKAAVNAQPTIKPGCAEPNSMQQAFLARLKALRSNGAERALLISATGTGKTFAAAFAVRDAIAQFQRTPSAHAPRDRESRHSQRFRMLFIVHREQIARQALKSFRIVLGDAAGSFGLLSGNEKASECDFVFATMQTLAKTAVLQTFPKDAFAFIIIDEVHRAGAPSYQRIMNWFRPAFWLGMTGSPERTDGFDIFKLFDHVIAHEIRLSEALEENLLTPFHYFGLSAGTEDETGEEAGQLPDFTNPNWPERIQHVIDQAEYFGSCGDRVKGLIFAGSLEEARAAAAAFTSAGHPAIALGGQTAQDEREAAIEQLTHGMGPNRLEYIATVDIFNEGVDIPEVNQILMLRRTESAIVFVQQLGRGLRRAADKEYVIVLDFIGNYEKMTESSVSLSTNRHGVPMCDSISNGAARSSPRSIFLSFVLLKDAAWCASAFVKRFRREWDDSIELEDGASSSTSCFIVDDVPVFIRLIPAPIPDNEALGAAEDNFLWRGDKSLVAHHRAHLIVTAPLPGKRAGRAFAKVCASLSGEASSVGIYINGVVHQPETYRDFAQCMKDGAFPTLCLVWVSVVRLESGGFAAWTEGLEALGRMEMEVPAADIDPMELFFFLADTADYVSENEVDFQDGETVSYTAGQKLPLERSPGIFLKGRDTWKIRFQPNELLAHEDEAHA